jgi:hypothetical protein
MLLLAAVLFVPLVFLRPASDRLDAEAATPPPDATLPAEATHSPQPADSDPTCGSATVSYDAIEPTIANRAEGASVVLLATVESIAEARWNTADGRAPKFEGEPPIAAYIFRPVSLSVDTLARGDVAGSTSEVTMLGGSVGCYTYDYENTPDLKVGQQYAFFLGASLTAAGGRDQAALTINEAWAVSDGLVKTPLEGDVLVAAFIATVEKAPLGPLGL